MADNSVLQGQENIGSFKFISEEQKNITVRLTTIDKKGNIITDEAHLILEPFQPLQKTIIKINGELYEDETEAYIYDQNIEFKMEPVGGAPKFRYAWKVEQIANSGACQQPDGTSASCFTVIGNTGVISGSKITDSGDDTISINFKPPSLNEPFEYKVSITARIQSLPDFLVNPQLTYKEQTITLTVLSEDLHINVQVEDLNSPDIQQNADNVPTFKLSDALQLRLTPKVVSGLPASDLENAVFRYNWNITSSETSDPLLLPQFEPGTKTSRIAQLNFLNTMPGGNYFATVSVDYDPVDNPNLSAKISKKGSGTVVFRIRKPEAKLLGVQTHHYSHFVKLFAFEIRNGTPPYTYTINYDASAQSPNNDISYTVKLEGTDEDQIVPESFDYEQLVAETGRESFDVSYVVKDSEVGQPDFSAPITPITITGPNLVYSVGVSNNFNKTEIPLAIHVEGWRDAADNAEDFGTGRFAVSYKILVAENEPPPALKDMIRHELSLPNDVLPLAVNAGSTINIWFVINDSAALSPFIEFGSVFRPEAHYAISNPPDVPLFTKIVTVIKGIGTATQMALKAINIETIGDFARNPLIKFTMNTVVDPKNGMSHLVGLDYLGVSILKNSFPLMPEIHANINTISIQALTTMDAVQLANIVIGGSNLAIHTVLVSLFTQMQKHSVILGLQNNLLDLSKITIGDILLQE